MANEHDIYQIIDAYFKAGWRIAPFKKKEGGGYHGVKQWPTRAATSHQELEDLCREMRPPFIFGVVPPEGRYILDLDTKGGKDGYTNWLEHIKRLFPLGDAPEPAIIVRSKSGGYHFYYQHTKKVKLPSPTAVLGKNSGVDIRGYTGMVVMPMRMGDDWQPGEYVMIHGKPDSPLTTLPFNQVVPREAVTRNGDADLQIIYEALQNKKFPPARRWEALPELVIGESGRDNTLFLAAKMCRRCELSHDDAKLFMDALAHRCELNEGETIDHWKAVAEEKLRRAYEGEHRIQSVNDFYNELKYAGVVRCAMEGGSIYYVRHGSKMLSLPPYRAYTVQAITDLLRGQVVSVSEQGKAIFAHKVFAEWRPEIIVDSYGMMPKEDEAFFYNAEREYCVNTYRPAFQGFEPDDSLQRRVREEVVPIFRELVYHVAGGEKSGDYLLQKFGWIVQRPYIKPVTANIIFSHTRGAGKDSLMDLIGQLFDPKYYIKLEEADFERNFNVYQEKLIAVFSEVQMSGNNSNYSRRDLQKLAGRIKQLITNRTILVEEKFKPSRMVESFTNFFMLSNYKLEAIMETGERRFDVFQCIEEKIDQSKFGLLLDVANRQNRRDVQFSDHNNIRWWDNILYGLREYLLSIECGDLRKSEAQMTELKAEMMAAYAGEAVTWLRENMPPYFTKDMVMWAATFCPHKIDHTYAFQRLQETFGLVMKPVKKEGMGHFRLKGSPTLQAKDDGAGRKHLTLEFGKTNDSNSRCQLYTFREDEISKSASESSEAFLKRQMKAWIDQMHGRYFGSAVTLPGAKIDPPVQEDQEPPKADGSGLLVP